MLNAMTDPTAAAARMAAVSSGRDRRMWDCLLHNRIEAPMVRTLIASPANHCDIPWNSGTPNAQSLVRPPIRAPHSAPTPAAPRTYTVRSLVLRRSGVPPHQARTTAAPTRASAVLPTAKPAEIAQFNPLTRSTMSSAITSAAMITGHRERCVSNSAATVIPPGTKNAEAVVEPNAHAEATAPAR